MYEEQSSQIIQQQQLIAKQRQQIEEAKQQAQSFDPRVMQTGQQLLKASPQTQAYIQNLQAQRQLAKQQAEQQIQQTQTQFEKGIQPIEAQLQEQQGLISQAEQTQQSYDIAKKYFYKGGEGAILVQGETPQVKEFYNQLKQGQEDAIQASIKKIESEAQMSFSPKLKEEIRQQIERQVIEHPLQSFNIGTAESGATIKVPETVMSNIALFHPESVKTQIPQTQISSSGLGQYLIQQSKIEKLPTAQKFEIALSQPPLQKAQPQPQFQLGSAEVNVPSLSFSIPKGREQSFVKEKNVVLTDLGIPYRKFEKGGFPTATQLKKVASYGNIVSVAGIGGFGFGGKLSREIFPPFTETYKTGKEILTAQPQSTLMKSQAKLREQEYLYQFGKKVGKVVIAPISSAAIGLSMLEQKYAPPKLEKYLVKVKAGMQKDPFAILLAKGAQIAEPSIAFGLMGIEPKLPKVISYNKVTGAPEYRVKRLSPKQSPRAGGYDIFNIEKGKIKFAEKITIPRRMQYVAPLQLDIPAHRVLYTPEVKLYYKSVSPMSVFQTGEEVGFFGATTLKKIKPKSPYQTFSMLGAKATPLEFGGYKPASISEARQLQSLFKSAGQTKIIQRGQPRLLVMGEGQKLYGGELLSYDILKSRVLKTPTKKLVFLRTIKEGKHITRGAVLGLEQKIPTGASAIEKYGYMFKSRETTFPFGKPRVFPVTKGISYVPTGNLFAEGGVSKVSNILLKGRTKAVIKQLTSQAGVMKASKISVPKVTKIPKLISVKPTATQVLRSQSLFYGKGMYERTEETAMPFSIPKTTTNTLETLRISPREANTLINVPRENLRELQFTVPREIQRITPRERQVPRETQKVSPREVVASLNISRETQRETQRQKEIQRQVQKQMQIPKQIQLSIRPRPRPQEIIFPPPFSEPKMPKKKSKISQFGFIPEMRRFGKFKPLSKPTTLERAMQIGKISARQTLGASIRIKSPKGFVRFAPSEEFRLAKKSPFILVQRKGARLSSPFEIKEIQAFRMKKGGIF